jgi:glycosyltransferase involved in cell wall biosynthesis
VTAHRVTLVEFSPSGGLFQFAFQLGRALAEEGHDVELVTGPHPELTNGGPLRVTPILPTWHPGAGVEPLLLRKSRRVVRAGRLVLAWVVLAFHLRRRRPDVVQFGEWHFSIDGAAAALLSRTGWSRQWVDLAHSPLPLTEQRGGRSAYRRGPLLRRGLAAGYRAMDAVLVLGEASRRDMEQAWPGVRRIDVVPHGDEEIFRHGPVPAPSSCGPRVLFFGALTGYKGLDVLLDAFSLVREQLPDAELVIAGPVVADLDLVALAERARRVGHVDLRPGYVPIDDVGPLLSSARLLVAPYLRSNASGVVRLAHTFERPVVVSDVGDLANSVRAGHTGLVVEPGDPRALADSMVRLLADPDEADRMGRAGRDHQGQEASWPQVARRVGAIYQELLEGTLE